ncbi:hypothetical protein F2Q70_00033346 [Brassica cretica]|uniref:MAT1 centre domain-containing protein n=1 Tax=Brassica cretica TaxID=69181 RepID=A0A8S9FDT4_BRACR|nr:hypothetical protein F2Q70_00033346 [Brassica cretica]
MFSLVRQSWSSLALGSAYPTVHLLPSVSSLHKLHLRVLKREFDIVLLMNLEFVVVILAASSEQVDVTVVHVQSPTVQVEPIALGIAPDFTRNSAHAKECEGSYGHEVPLHRPKEALALFQAFISGTSLPTPENSIRSDKSELVEPTDESILCRYNKREEDFSALKDYNDYLEEVECMNGINVGAIEDKIKRYSQENAEQIMVNRARKVTNCLW